MDLEQTLTSRETINSQLRGVLDEATGKWGIRVNRVELKAIDPPKSIKEAMEKQMRAERDKRAAILTAEGFSGSRRSSPPRARSRARSCGPRATGAPRSSRPRPVPGDRRGVPGGPPQRPRPGAAGLPVPADAPELAKGQGNTFWVIPSEVTSALQGVSKAFTEVLPRSAGHPRGPPTSARRPPGRRPGGEGRRRGGRGSGRDRLRPPPARPRGHRHADPLADLQKNRHRATS